MYAATRADIRTIGKNVKPEKEAIHSGHFMVSHFEAEAQDDEDELAVPVPDEDAVHKAALEVIPPIPISIGKTDEAKACISVQPLAIDTSLSKLFQCMSLAYRQKLTSPKWNRFRGIRLRWKDKIRLNNVIWRCWHLQFIKKEHTLICQFASPLDVDTHNKPEAVVLEGKYWKRKLEAVTAEYKKWRMYYRNQSLGQLRDTADMLNDVDLLTWNSQSTENMHMMVDEDYMGLMSDTLFSTITNQPFVFPDSREIAKAGLADFIQPSLGPLQPNLDDYMDTFEPLQDFIGSKLAPVPEEQGADNLYKSGWGYTDYDIMGAASSVNIPVNAIAAQDLMHQYQSIQQQPQVSTLKVELQDTKQQLPTYNNEIMMPSQINTFIQRQSEPSQYQSSVITKTSKPVKDMTHNQLKIDPMPPPVFGKSIDNVYSNYNVPELGNSTSLCSVENRLAMIEQPQQSTSNLQNFRLPNVSSSSTSSQSSQGYKFPTPMAPNLKFTSQKEEKPTNRARTSAQRGKQRSRSNPRESTKRPPLLSAISDPALLPPSSSVLTQLLTNSSDSNNLYLRNTTLTHQDHRSNNIRIKEENLSVPILPQPVSNTTTAALIITPVQMSTSDQLLLSQISSASNSPALEVSSQNVNSPTSSQGSLGSPNREGPQRDQRRAGHIHAEQKRRCHIKNGFDMIQSLIPHLNQNPNAKLSKAAMLQKGAEYIRQLRMERNQLSKEMEELRQEIDSLNTSMSNFQSLLPATGAPVSRRRDNKMQERFDEYVRTRTMENWKFWILSLLFRPLLVSFNNLVSTSSLDDLYRSTLHWIEQQCTLVDLRPIALNSLRYLCTKTDILSEPEKFPEEARQAVMTNQNPSN